MRKIASITIICSLVLSLVACGKNSSDNSNSSIDETTVNIQETETTVDSSDDDSDTDNNSSNEIEETTVEETVTGTETSSSSDDTFSYTSLKDTLFSFSSGAGGWCTELFIAEDGSFNGNYHDFDFEDPDDENAKGLMYSCEFEGNFGELEKVDELTYKTTIQNIVYKNAPDTKEKIDGVSYLYTTAYGLDEAEDIYFYLPGSKVNELPEDFVTWVNMALYDYDNEKKKDTLDFVGLYNEKPKYGFSSSHYSNNYTDYAKNVNGTKELSDSLRKEMQEEALNQTELNEKSKDLYELWDNQLNDLWAVLVQTLPENEMKDLKSDEINWINKKEKKLKKIRKKYKGGSMAPMQEYLKAADLTEDRVYVLLKYLE